MVESIGDISAFPGKPSLAGPDAWHSGWHTCVYRNPDRINGGSAVSLTTQDAAARKELSSPAAHTPCDQEDGAGPRKTMGFRNLDYLITLPLTKTLSLTRLSQLPPSPLLH